VGYENVIVRPRVNPPTHYLVSFGQFSSDFKSIIVSVVGEINRRNCGVSNLSNLIANVNGVFNEAKNSLSVLELLLFVMLTFVIILGFLEAGHLRLEITGGQIAIQDNWFLGDSDCRADGYQE
jgi:hypothetical protein